MTELSKQGDPITANWNIMVYIAADDVLAGFAVESLRQLKRNASSNVVVTAQFDVDGKRNIPRYVFDGDPNKTGPLDENVKDTITVKTNMADPCALGEFIDWAYSQRSANHYALVLWGHGPELLLENFVTPGAQKEKTFLTPLDLKTALAQSQKLKQLKQEKRNLDILIIDACNMSMMETALEVQGYVRFLIASQEDVPDFSFSYESLLYAFSQATTEEDVTTLCKRAPGGYIAAYQDFIRTQQQEIDNITLSSFSLANTWQTTGLVKRLAEALMDSVNSQLGRQAVIAARANSKSFVSGLYVDLFDFCSRLRSRVVAKNANKAIDRSTPDDKLISICEQICDVIRLRTNNAFVIENEVSKDKTCNGLSIYFPYVTGPDQSALGAPLAGPKAGGANGLTKNTGGTDVLVKNSGSTDVLIKNSADVLNTSNAQMMNKIRLQRIQETEGYYQQLELSTVTGWGEFIQHGWSRCLAEEVAAKVKAEPFVDFSQLLDQYYSAQQCALNLLSLCHTFEENRQPPDRTAGRDNPTAGPDDTRQCESALVGDGVRRNGDSY